jgi:hypothetical protein
LIEGKSYCWGLAKKPGFLYFLANHPEKVKTTNDPCPWKKFMIHGLIPILPGGKRHEREDGVKITGCGLGQTNVPCEYEIPRLIQKERKK